MTLKKSIIALFIFGMSASICTAQDNIADARNNYSLGQTVTVSGIVTNDDDLGVIRYIQDATAGIALYPPAAGWLSLGFGFIPTSGDSITITGILTEHRYLLEIGPNITSLVLESTGHPLPDPVPLTPGQFGETYEGMLVSIDGAVFNAGGNTFGSSNYSFVASGEEGIIFLAVTSPLLGELIPSGPLFLTGILSQFSYDDPNGGYQLLPRNEDDLVSENAINFLSKVVQTELSTVGFNLSWSTDVSSSTEVWYGTTPDLGSTATNTDPVVDHAIALEGLATGTPYYCQVYAVAGEDTAFSPIRVYSTVSESSGRINVYFNRSVDNSVATISNAISLFSATDDTIIAQIDRAMITLDIAVYNNNSGQIVQSINNALDRGVIIRYIAEGQTANTALSSLNSSIPVLFRENAMSSGMHNKFVIVDPDDVDNALVLTGSTNFTSNNLFSDPNNMVIVQDQALARGYTLEFEEMWGSTGPQPDPVASRFGEFKSYNTPEKFIIGGRNVELYFSPTDNTTQAIARAISKADYDLDFALLLITNDILAEAIADRVSIFLQPRGVLDDINGSGSDYQFLLDNGVVVVQHTVDGQLHHKYATIDHSQPAADPTVVTGSHNWSASAESTNDENTLIIHDAEIANLYFQEFMARFAESTVSTSDHTALVDMEVYPNPTTDRLLLTFHNASGSEAMLTIVDMNGKVVAARHLIGIAGGNRVELSLGGLPQGVYVLHITTSEAVGVKKIVVRK